MDCVLRAPKHEKDPADIADGIIIYSNCYATDIYPNFIALFDR
jgi:hypothetical protein